MLLLSSRDKVSDLHSVTLKQGLAGTSGKEVTKRQTESSDSNEGCPPFIELLRGRDGRDGRHVVEWIDGCSVEWIRVH